MTEKKLWDIRRKILKFKSFFRSKTTRRSDMKKLKKSLRREMAKHAKN